MSINETVRECSYFTSLTLLRHRKLVEGKEREVCIEDNKQDWLSPNQQSRYSQVLLIQELALHHVQLFKFPQWLIISRRSREEFLWMYPYWRQHYMFLTMRRSTSRWPPHRQDSSSSEKDEELTYDDDEEDVDKINRESLSKEDVHSHSLDRRTHGSPSVWKMWTMSRSLRWGKRSRGLISLQGLTFDKSLLELSLSTTNRCTQTQLIIKILVLKSST